MEAVWYMANNGQQVGPMTLEDLVGRLRGMRAGAVGGEGGVLVFGPGMSQWAPAGRVPDVAARIGGAGATGGMPPPPPINYGAGGYHPRSRSDEIDYEVFGSEMQYAEVTLDPGEQVTAESGAMFFMEPGIQMNTVFGDPSKQNQGFLGKIASAGKRVLTGESLFVTTFTNQGHGKQKIAFAAPYPGKIIPIHLDRHGGELICQKESFLCAARGVQVSIAFQKRIGAALFGGEGFIMQRLQGDGVALVHAGGTILERELRAGETLRIDTGCLVALERSVNYDIQFTGGLKNSLFGGEGLFLATVSGPGKIWLQSLPFSRLAGRVLANATATGNKDEGSVLGNLGGLLGNSD